MCKLVEGLGDLVPFNRRDEPALTHRVDLKDQISPLRSAVRAELNLVRSHVRRNNIQRHKDRQEAIDIVRRREAREIVETRAQVRIR